MQDSANRLITTFAARRRVCASAFVLVSVYALSVGHAQKPTAKAGRIKCKLGQVKDTDRSGLVAYTYFLPDGWTSQSTMKWGRMDSTIVTISASTPDNLYAANHIEPMVVHFEALKSYASPSGFHIAHATDFLHLLVTKIQQQFQVDKVSIEEEVNKPLPLTPYLEGVAKTATNALHDGSVFRETGYLKVRFTINGTEEVAELGTIAGGLNQTWHFVNNPNAITNYSGMYTVGPTVVIVSPAKPSAARENELKVIASSIRKTSQFQEYVNNLARGTDQAIHNEYASALQEKNATWHEHSMAAFRSQMASRDANSRQFCNYLLDQQDYKNRGGGLVTLPSAYNHVWADNKGEYLLTNDSSLDPGVAGSGDWQELEKARPGH
jgi:hypothetical protein